MTKRTSDNIGDTNSPSKPKVIREESYNSSPLDNNTDPSLEFLGQEEESQNENLIQFTYKNNPTFKALEIGMNSDWSRIDKDTPDNISAVCSYGFASCVATFIISTDNTKISLRHDSYFGNGDGDDSGLIQSINAEVIKMKEETNQQDVKVKFGFDYTSFQGGIEDEKQHLRGTTEEITRGVSALDESYANHLKFIKALKYEVIDLPQSTILIDRNGIIDTSIPDQILRYAIKCDQENLLPRSSISDPKLAIQLNTQERSAHNQEI